jgi:hypothetical protein
MRLYQDIAVNRAFKKFAENLEDGKIDKIQFK